MDDTKNAIYIISIGADKLADPNWNTKTKKLRYQHKLDRLTELDFLNDDPDVDFSGFGDPDVDDQDFDINEYWTRFKKNHIKCLFP